MQRRLGEGGMGVVYQVFDRERKALVALKTLRQDDPAAIYRFKREFRSLADINHPNLVTLHELVSLDDQWFFTMELIDGVDFLTFVRNIDIGGDADTLTSPLSADLAAAGDEDRRVATPPPGFERLRRALRQLAEGVQALHDAGKLHRDIKPSNVLVTHSGRVVLLDFGLVIDLDRIDTTGGSRLLVGTVVYMAPEQAASHELTPASDWYSVGVILYEALTGLVPFDGPPLSVVMRKQKELPPPPGELLPNLPRDLAQLCMALLAVDPLDRPGGQAVLGHLGIGAAGPLRPTMSRSDVFIGRGEQLAALRRAASDVAGGATVCVFIHGRSGMGKTALLDRFLSEQIGGPAVVLEGRCYEREYVPYKALDALVDSLTQYLARLPTAEAHSLVPEDAPAIARLFPVFRRLADRPGRGKRIDAGDPQKLRQRGTRALRRLLARLAARAPLILSIDNLQWSDLDSVSVLIDLIRPPESPPLLLLVGYRSEEATGNRAVRLFLRSLRTADIDRREVVVGALGAGEIRALVRSRLGDDSPAAQVFGESLIDESHGNPFFIDELVRYIQSGAAPSGERSSVSLEDAIVARVAHLPDGAHRLLELVALAGRPMSQAIVAEAAELGSGYASAVAVLRAGFLIRTRGTRDPDRIEVYHDRIRETVVAKMDAGRARTLHARLAHALELSGRATPEALVYHFSEAGDDERAGDHATSAAERAARALAFERAAELYRLAIDCLPEAVVVERRLRVALGDALANAGLGAQAAGEYTHAAGNASAAEALELERRAAEQLLRAGYVDEGLDALRSVASAVGIPMAPSQGRALAAVLSRRARLRVRGYRFKERDTSQIAAEELTRIDVCWSAATGLSMIDTVHGADFQSRHLMLALKAGEPYRVLRALALEAMYSATIGAGKARRTLRFLSMAKKLAKGIAQPHAAALTAMAGAWAEYHAGAYSAALTGLDRAAVILADECTGVAFEIAAVDRLIADTLFHLGRIAALRNHVRVKLREAQRRGDRYSATTMRIGLANAIWLAEDDPARATTEADKGLERWSRSGFYLQHYHHAAARAMAALYRGDPEQARSVVMASWPALERSMLLGSQTLRTEALFLRGRIAVDRAHGRERAGRPTGDLDDATLMARKLAQEGVPVATAASRVLQAGIANIRGAHGQCRELIARAERTYEAADMALMAAACRRLRGALAASVPASAPGAVAGAASGDGDGTDSELVESADRWLRGQGIVAPRRFAELVLGIRVGEPDEPDAQDEPDRSKPPGEPDWPELPGEPR